MGGAELFSSKPLLAVAIQTYNEAWQQWDTTQCTGGIYWSRDRSPTNLKQGYKSAITNSQHMMLGARLYILTKDPVYIVNAKLVYSWLRQGLINQQDWSVRDGVDGNQGCGMNIDVHSYNSGILLGALGWLFKATNDPAWLSDGSKILARTLATFSSSGIIFDPCEPNCAQNSVQAKGTMIRGLGYYASFTNSQQDKQSIRSVLGTSLTKMAGSCDQNGNCPAVWTTPSQGYNFHTQMVALELVNAYTNSINGPSTASFAPPTTLVEPTKSAGIVSMSSISMVIALVAAVLIM